MKVKTENNSFIDKYLQRIHCEDYKDVSLKNLFKLQQRNLEHIVYENVDCFFKREISLELDILVNKVLIEKKGGFCFELNTLFYHLLKALGYTVSIHEGFVYNAINNKLIPDTIGPHMVLVVAIDGQKYITDVGFSSRCFFSPLELSV